MMDLQPVQSRLRLTALHDGRRLQTVAHSRERIKGEQGCALQSAQWILIGWARFGAVSVLCCACIDR